MSDDDFTEKENGATEGERDVGSSRSADRGSDIGTREGADSTNQLLRVLANDRRRFLLATLSESEDGVASLSELTKVIARRDSEERGVPIERSLEEAAVSLHHVHLPKLQASGLVDYDELSGCVRYLGGEGVDALVELTVEGDP